MAEEATESTETVEAPPAPPRAEAVEELSERFARGLDKVAPLPKSKSQPQSAPQSEEPPAPPTREPEKELPKPKPKEPAPKAPPAPPEGTQILPSFLTQKPEAAAPATPEEVEIPEQLPGIKGKATTEWGTFREQYKKRGNKINELTTRLGELEAQAGKPDAATQARLTELEEQNQQLLGITEKVAIQNSPRFIAQVVQPRQNALDYAKGIVKDAGGNPIDLEKALAVPGPAQYAALEDIYNGLPEVAKGELSAVIKDIRLYDRQRDQILSDPKRSLESIRKEELIAQQRQLQEQERETDSMLERTLVRMREHNKVEVLQRSPDPKDKWWNDQVDQIEATARQLAKTHDPEQLMAAIALAPMTDVYRKLFLDSQKRIQELEARQASFESHAPSLDGEGGEPVPAGEKRKKELEKPIGQAFRDILQRNRRQ